jgi:hypothetical protein
MSFVKTFDELPFLVKVLFALPVLNIVWAIYRIVKGACTENYVMLVVGIIWILAGSSICWILDLVFLLLGKDPILTK